MNYTPDYTDIFCETYDEMEPLKDPARYGEKSDLGFYMEKIGPPQKNLWVNSGVGKWPSS